ncbi:MAG: hypothetical protein IJX52_07450 [Oscillibacter sp.]|nr:hypothetical protein [Oscillibacter sp.]
MDRNLDYTLLYRVAKAYYLDQKTQQEIADVENFSRSQISRILKKALDEGLVTYTLNFPAVVDEEAMTRELQSCLGLEKVVLIPSFYQEGQKPGADLTCKNLALGAAEKLPELLGDAKNIGIGWGRTLYNASLCIRPQRYVKGRTFLPLIGLSGDNNPMLQVNTIVDRFGERFHADRKYVNMQSLLAKDALGPMVPTSIQSLMAKWEVLDAAIIGIGGPPAGNVNNLISEFPRNYKKQVQSSGTVGDILSQFFYEDGRIFQMDDHYRLLALDIGKLRSVKNVIAMASGSDKRDPIRVAARLGYIKTLITDYNTAQEILTIEGVDYK